MGRTEQFVGNVGPGKDRLSFADIDVRKAGQYSSKSGKRLKRHLVHIMLTPAPQGFVQNLRNRINLL